MSLVESNSHVLLSGAQLDPLNLQDGSQVTQTGEQAPPRLESSDSQRMSDPSGTVHSSQLMPDADHPAPLGVHDQDVVQGTPQNQGGAKTYKSRDLTMKADAAGRLQTTLKTRAGKAAKLKENSTASRKDVKSRFDKFLKEFKGVFKNIGKLGKAVGDSSKGIREASVTGDMMRLGGGDGSGLKDINKALIKADGMSAQLGDMSKAMGGIASICQLVETGADIYMFHGKNEKMKLDEASVQSFSDAVKELRQARKDLAILKNPTSNTDPAVLLAAQQNVDKLTQKVNDTAIGNKLAHGDIDKFYDDLGIELAKLYKSGGDGAKAALDFARIFVQSGSVAADMLKVAGATVGVVIGPLTFVLNAKEGVKDVQANLDALKLKHAAQDAIKGKAIQQDDAELLAIASRIQLKQKKHSVDKGLSATKNAFGAVGGLASGFAGAATIAAMATGAAVGVAAIATPIGWALAGAAALAAIGYGCYKLARHINSSGIKQALQQSIQTLNKPEFQDGSRKLGDIRNNLSGKEIKALDKVAAKLIATLQSQGVADIPSPNDLTLDQLKDYSMKKLLARDTGVATSSLYHRFKDEAAKFFSPKDISQVTEKDMQTYLDAEGLKPNVDSAASLMAKLGLKLSDGDALLLLKTGEGGETSALKFLGKKLKLIL